MSGKPSISPEVLVSIPDCTATHILGETTAELGRGTLTLMLTESSSVSAPLPSSPSGANQHPLLTLTVGNAAFPLFKTSTFGTMSDDIRVYVFTPEMGGERGGYVRITLPEGIAVQGSPFEELHVRFEEALVRHGLLKEGVQAAADEVGKSMREGSQNASQSIRQQTTEYIAKTPATEDPIAVPGAVQSATSSSASGASTFASAVGSVMGLVSSAAGSAGAWVTSHLVPTTTPATQTLTSLSSAWDITSDGYASGSADVQAALTDAAGTRIENGYGHEARVVAEDTGATVRNVGTAVEDVMVNVGGPGLAAAGLKGAAGTQKKEQDEQDRKGEKLEDRLEDVSF